MKTLYALQYLQGDKWRTSRCRVMFGRRRIHILRLACILCGRKTRIVREEIPGRLWQRPADRLP